MLRVGGDDRIDRPGRRPAKAPPRPRNPSRRPRTGAAAPSQRPAAAGGASPTSRKSRKLILIGGGAVAVVAVALIGWRVTTPPISDTELRSRLAAAMSPYRCASLRYQIAPDGSVLLSGEVGTADELERLAGDVGRIRGAGLIQLNVKIAESAKCDAAAAEAKPTAPETSGAPTAVTEPAPAPVPTPPPPALPAAPPQVATAGAPAPPSAPCRS